MSSKEILGYSLCSSYMHFDVALEYMDYRSCKLLILFD